MVNLKLIFLLTIIVSVSALSGCSSSRGELLPLSSKIEKVDYLIGPGDQLQVFVWRNPDLSSEVVVRPDGRISSPLIDDLEVSGLKATDVARNIEEILSEYIRNPKVSVIISGFIGTSSQQVRVIGNAANPMVIPYRAGMTLLDVMIEVNGLSDFADGDNAQLIRNINGKQKQYTILLESLVKGGSIKENRVVHPGDTIIIPESWF